MIRIVLYEPEIPPNTGNVMRLAVNLRAELRLVKPLGFELTDTRLKRAGMDYREYADVRVFDSLADAVSDVPLERRFALSTKGGTRYDQVAYCPGDALVFGPESRGLPDAVLASFGDRVLRIPMHRESRSLNLANAVAVVAFEAWRQHDFDGAHGQLPSTLST